MCEGLHWQGGGTYFDGGALRQAVFAIGPDGAVDIHDGSNPVQTLDALPIRIADREERAASRFGPTVAELNNDRIRLRQYRTRGDRIRGAIAQSLALPEAEGEALRRDYAAELLSDTAGSVIPDLGLEQHRTARDLLQAGVSPDLALQLAGRAHAQLPDAPLVAASHGWALLAADRVPEALPILERAAEDAPSEAEVLALLGRAYRLDGQAQEARATLEAAAAAAPEPRWTEVIDRERALLGIDG